MYLKFPNTGQNRLLANENFDCGIKRQHKEDLGAAAEIGVGLLQIETRLSGKQARSNGQLTCVLNSPSPPH